MSYQQVLTIGVYLKMSNQRPGKLQKPLDRNGDMQVYKFFKTAAMILNDSGKEDEAFYFEMIRDHIKDGGDLDPDNVSMILGL